MSRPPRDPSLIHDHPALNPKSAPRWALKLGALLGLALVAAAFASTAAVAQQGPSTELLAEFRGDPMSFFFDLREMEAIQCGQVLLAGDSGLGPEERREVFTALAAIYLATQKRDQARAALYQVLDQNPQMELPHPELLPPPLVHFFYTVRDSILQQTGNLGQTDIRTLAVGDIENNSIVTGKYDLDAFVEGLRHIITTDLIRATPLKVVDRQRLKTLMSEIEMSRSSDIMNPEYAVPLGKLTGAQSFLFGSLMQIDKKKIRLDLRWVDTSTSEILLSEGVEAKLDDSEDLFKLERELLLEILVPRMQAWLSGHGEIGDFREPAEEYLEEKQKHVKGAKENYVDFLIKSGEAMLAEDRGDLQAAQTAWEDAQALWAGDPTAGKRARTLNAHLALASR